MNKIRVRVELAMDVDVDTWGETYGVDADEVPDDVRRYVLNRVWQSPAVEEHAVFSAGIVPASGV